MTTPSLPRNGMRKVQEPAHPSWRSHTILPSTAGLLLQLSGLVQKPINKEAASTAPQTSRHHMCHQHAITDTLGNEATQAAPTYSPENQPLPPSLQGQFAVTQAVGRGREKNMKHHTYSATFLPLKIHPYLEMFAASSQTRQVTPEPEK